MHNKQNMIGFTVFSLLAAYCADNTVSGFTTTTATSSRPRKTTTMTELQMGLFDGVKEAFAAPALERSEINKERETPIDRWMGWSVVSEKDEMANQGKGKRIEQTTTRRKKSEGMNDAHAYK